MKLVIFGLTISSSWGNGHATLWRGLCRAMTSAGHEVVFFERDVPYYRAERDDGPFGCEWILYGDWRDVADTARNALSNSDAAIVTSYCPDALSASELVLDSRIPVRVFYDLDTPVTLARLRAGESVEYLPADGLGDFDLVLSFAGGRALDELRSRLGARRVAPLYGSVDASRYRPVSRIEKYVCDLSYLGTYSPDRHDALKASFFATAADVPELGFVLGGAMYSKSEPWPKNVRHFEHVAPHDHPAFFCSSRLTLNVTRRPMIELGHCPSGRLFEAAACGTPIISDDWEGLSSFFEPGREILVFRDGRDVRDALELGSEELGRMARAARERVVAEHRAEARAKRLVELLSSPSDEAPEPRHMTPAPVSPTGRM